MSKPAPPTLQILLFGAVASGLIYGYNAGVHGGVMLQIKGAFDLSDAQLGHLIAVFDYAEIVGVCLAPVADRIGRRRVLMICAAILSFAPFILLLDPSFAVVFAERAITGCVAGLTFMMALVFVAEIATPVRRATLLSSVMIGVSAGYVAELGLSIAFVEGDGWRIVIMLAAVPALVQLVGLGGLPESPTFHQIRGDHEAATGAAAHYGLTLEPLDPASHGRSWLGTVRAVLHDRHVMRNLLLGIVIVLAGTISGGALVSGYGPLLMTGFGIADTATVLELMIVFTIAGFAVGFVALIPIHRGKTPLVLTGSLLVASFSLFALFLADGVVAIALLGLLQLAFAFGIRTTVFQLLPSFLTDEIRVMGMAFYNLVFIFLAGTMNDVFPVLLERLAERTFLLFGAIALVLAVASAFALRARAFK